MNRFLGDRRNTKCKNPEVRGWLDRFLEEQEGLVRPKGVRVGIKREAERHEKLWAGVRWSCAVRKNFGFFLNGVGTVGKFPLNLKFSSYSVRIVLSATWRIDYGSTIRNKEPVKRLKLQYFGHVMQRTDSLEKTLMLGKIEGGRRRG